MPCKARRIIAGISWVVGSLIVWAAVWNIFYFALFIYLRKQQFVLPTGINPAAFAAVLNWIPVAGYVMIPVILAILAMRSKLPWTARRHLRPGGFSVQPPRQ